MSNETTQPEKPSVTRQSLDLDLVDLIAKELKAALLSMPTDLALRYAEKIVEVLYRERYLKEDIFL
jgi:hypothetical protein